MRNLPTPKWYWATRSIGVFIALYELLSEAPGAPERGTVIVAALGFAGLDFVSRRDRRNAD